MMGKLVRCSQSYDLKTNDPEVIRHAVSDAIVSAVHALMWDIERMEKIALPSTIKLEMETEKWDWQIKATLEWGE